MIRKALFTLSLLSTGLCFAAPLTPEEAISRIDDGFAGNTRSMASVRPAMVVSTHIGDPALYVFEKDNSRGFMIVSADDAVTPLLGYSDDNNFDLDNVPPALQEWMDEYARQIEYVRENYPQALAENETRVALPGWATISPLLKTKWGQGTPYNNLCPKYSGERSATGCVATSMAQVMNYFQWPEKLQKNISYYCNSVGQTLKLDASTTFDWKNMLNTYTGTYNDAQATAVATLMQAAGYSVNMSYTNNFSGALSGLISGSLITYFNYDKGMRYEKRSMYTYTDWATKIYNNLKNVGPIIYDGNSLTGSGHSFVCDGFRDGYFHFNWGWNGTSDGYFLLDALNPPSLGTGGGDGGYNFTQDALFGIRKPTGQNVAQQDELVIYGSIQGFINDDNELSMDLIDGDILGWAYVGASDILVTIGASFVPADNTSATPVYMESTNAYNVMQILAPGEYIPTEGTDRYGRLVSLRPTFPLSSLNLTQGVKYKVTNVGRNDDTGEWLDFGSDVGSYNYFYITKTGSGNTAADYKIESFDPMQFTCKGLELKSDLYNGIAVDVNASLTNNNDTELTRGVSLILINMDGVIQYVGSTTLITLAPGESTTLDWTTSLTSQTGATVSKKTEFYAALYDPNTETIYYKSPQTVTMAPFPGTPAFQCTIEVEDATYRGGKYYVADASNFNVSSTIKVTRNIFSYPVELWVAEAVGSTYYRTLSFPYEVQVINTGETYTFNSNVNFPDAVVGRTYYLLDFINKAAQGLTPFVAEGNSGAVEELISDNAEIVFLHNKAMDNLIVTGGENGISSVEVYSLNGIKLSPEASHFGDNVQIDLSSLGKGVVVVTAIDGKGNRKSQKIAL